MSKENTMVYKVRINKEGVSDYTEIKFKHWFTAQAFAKRSLKAGLIVRLIRSYD